MGKDTSGQALRPTQPSRWPWLAALAVLAGVLALILVYWQPEGTPGKPSAPVAGQAPAQAPAEPSAAPPPPPPSAQGQVVEVTNPEQGLPSAAQAKEQAQRKEPYGLSKSLDAVVRSDESVKVGEHKVTVAELERKLVVEQRGELLDKPLGQDQKVTAWGVHVVRRGDNLWEIHYALLREYLTKRGIHLEPHADQPTPQGFSSGVGKVLKFAENMVGVYNLKTGHMSRDLNLLEPGQKMVIFNLSEIFEQLARIEPADLQGVMYDGRVLLFPKRQSEPVPPAQPAPGEGPAQPPAAPPKS